MAGWKSPCREGQHWLTPGFAVLPRGWHHTAAPAHRGTRHELGRGHGKHPWQGWHNRRVADECPRCPQVVLAATTGLLAKSCRHVPDSRNKRLW